MLTTAIYWLFIALVATGKVVAFVALVVFAIAMPLARIQVARQRPSRGLDRAVATNLGIAALGLVGVYVLLENARIFLQAF
ncbi:MAG TPA: hypothetical protein VD978_22275 [Azospirillum sp.]|nr:hypothetical protein [Azospirillum sp.]